MLKSMTGYGRAEVKDRTFGEFYVEIQGINRKYCDININLPKNLLALESKIRDIITVDITRGRINVFVGHIKSHIAQRLNINTDLVKEYYGVLKKVKRELKLKGELDISLISGLKEFIMQTEPQVDVLKVWPVIEKALKNSIKNFQAMREKEGIAISCHIEEPLKDIEGYIAKVKNISPQLVINFKEKLENRLKEAGISVSYTDERVQKEVAILAEHSDITEEINRMESHISQFKSLMKKNESVGRTMDFLIQEMMRETNTMGSKAMHSEISTCVVNMKSLLEKIREQIQNVE